MNIVIVSPEAAPFAKTGGLADVAGALPKFLAQLKHKVCLFMPYYPQVKQGKFPVKDTGKEISVNIADKTVTGKIFEGQIPDSKVPVYFIVQDGYFDRPELYKDRETGKDYGDQSERFIFFSRAVLEAIEALGIKPDVIHCNDWQSALIPAYVKTLYKEGRAVSGAGTVFTVHNLGYQGMFWHWDMHLTGLDWSLFNWKQLEYYGHLNFLKAGLVFADVINTVSRTYAKEIQTEEFGVGLQDVLKERSKDLYGVVNGIDYSVWSPEVDTLIAKKFSANDLSGKDECKKQLLKTQKLPKKKNVPLIGIISRLDKQKGFDILEQALPEIMERNLQIVVLGTGEAKYHELFQNAAKKFPQKIAVNLAFNNKLAHEIEAGSDMFLMPSRYEPCGLNQLYSLKYGTVPVVRSTGGLADTVIDCTPETLEAEIATGFVFDEYTSDALIEVIDRALEVWNRQPDWEKLMRNGMEKDWSWSRSAKEYVTLYKKASKVTEKVTE